MSKKKDQVNYNGMWVDKDSFRAFVYRENGEQRLANTYDEFTDLISQGYWQSPEGPTQSEQHINDQFIAIDDFKESPDFQEIDSLPKDEPPRRGRKRKQIDILS